MSYELYTTLFTVWAVLMMVVSVTLAIKMVFERQDRTARSRKRVKKSPPRKRKSALKRFFLFLKRHWPKRKKKQEVPRVEQPAPVPAAPSPLVAVSAPAKNPVGKKSGKTSGWVIAALVIAFLFLLGGVLAIIVLLLPLVFLWFIPGTQGPVQEASASIPPETISEIAGLILRFVLAVLGWRVV